MKRLLVVACVWIVTLGAGAQTVDPQQELRERQALIEKLLRLQQPGVESVARMLAQQPAMVLMQRAGGVLQRYPKEKREAKATEIQADLKRYLDSAVPLLRERAVAIAPSVLGPELEKSFTTDELRQLVAMIESPVNRKFLALGPQLQQGLADKLVEDSKDRINPTLKELQKTVQDRLSDAPAPTESSPAAK